MDFKKTISSLFFWAILIAVVSLGIYLFYLVNFFSYDELIEIIGRITGKPDWVDVIRSFFPKETFVQLKQISVFVLILFLVLVGVFLFFCKRIIRFFSNYFDWISSHISEFKQLISALSAFQRVIFYVISVIFLIKAYTYVFTWPMQYDEAWTFNYFINNSWITPLITPHNNHILYTIIGKLFHEILPFEAIYSIRFPLPIIAYCTGLLLLYSISKKMNAQLGLVTLVVFLSIPFVTFYSLYARAYMLGMFFAAVQFAVFIALVTNAKNQRWLLFTLGISTALGLYSVPTFFYFTIAIYTVLGLFFLAKKQFTSLIQLVLVGFAGIGFTLFLYSPMILVTKLSWLTSAVSAKNINFSLVIPDFLNRLGDYSLGVRHWIVYLLFAIATSGFLFIKKSKRWILFLVLIILLIPVFSIIIQKQDLFPRIFSHNAVAVAFLLAFLLVVSFKRLKSIPEISSIVLFLLLSIQAHHSHFFTWSNQSDKLNKQAASYLLENEINEVYNCFYYAKPALEYYYNIKDEQLTVYMPQPGSKDYQIFDSTKKYQSVLLYLEEYNIEDFPAYEVAWQKDYVAVLVPKDTN